MAALFKGQMYVYVLFFEQLLKPHYFYYPCFLALVKMSVGILHA